MQEHDLLSEIQKKWHGSLKSYIIGFCISLLLTAIAFSLVGFRLMRGDAAIFSIVGLGILQAIAQMLFFLHIGKESKPRWETLLFLFMVLILVIIVIGSLWIMYDLNHRTM
jgi:cytochrome o ubiquinol oxidase operon protein cyoD